MGTRHLTIVQHENKYKVAQYGQWDGYLEGQGVKILEFLKTKFKKELFIKKLKNCRYLTKEEIEDKWVECGAKKGEDLISYSVCKIFSSKYPSLSRDTGSDILKLIQNSKQEVPLYDDLLFVTDSLFCEYAYVIDLDKVTFEIYKGFNKEKLTSNERFCSFSDIGTKSCSGQTYYPVKFLGSFSLNKLPSKKTFLKLGKGK